jgi:cytochrome oxidase Cu insertion factor (SCO1/SenC/PrrC family)
MERAHKALKVLIVLLAPVLIGLFISRRVMEKNRALPEAQAELPLPDYGPVANFQLTDQSGKPFGLKDLKGGLWLADFIFTRCSGPCPLITAKMAELQKDFTDRPDLRFVSFSVDPAHDTPEVLSRYAETYGADPRRWRFLTGETQKIYDLVLKSFHLAVQANASPDQKPGEQVIHSLHFVLVDRDGRVRGYYTSTDAAALAKLREDINRLF